MTQKAHRHKPRSHTYTVRLFVAAGLLGSFAAAPSVAYGQSNQPFLAFNTANTNSAILASAPADPSITESQSTPSVPDSNNVTITAGTLSASLYVPVNGASRMHVQFGNNPSILDQSTPDSQVSGTNVTLLLNSLSPATTYTYQIIRTMSDGSVTTSDSDTFVTPGFNLVATFFDKNKKPVANVAASLKELEGNYSSDNSGNVTFSNVPPGAYTLVFQYGGATHTVAVNVDPSKVSSKVANSTDTITLREVVNVDAFVSASSKAWIGVVMVIVAALVIFAFLVWFLHHRRRRKNMANQYGNPQNRQEAVSTTQQQASLPPTQPVSASLQPVLPDMPTETPAISPLPVAPPVQPNLPVPPSEGAKQPPPTTEHAGMSLKELVMESMKENAQKNKQPPE